MPPSFLGQKIIAAGDLFLVKLATGRPNHSFLTRAPPGGKYYVPPLRDIRQRSATVPDMHMKLSVPYETTI